MKIKLGILTALLFMSSIVPAQIRYSYDASGVRVKAHLDVEKIEDNQHDAAEMVIDTTLQNTIDIYPNPAINLLTIKPKSDLEYKVQIYDFSAQKAGRFFYFNQGQLVSRVMSIDSLPVIRRL
ncbi:MAG: hypothetical protein ACK44P_08955 [Bacteroidota bacterium]|jgi:hypothetical protein|nr:T9SS type A sorting domain-containing protein [Sphingobacteriales bacterium]